MNEGIFQDLQDVKEHGKKAVNDAEEALKLVGSSRKELDEVLRKTRRILLALSGQIGMLHAISEHLKKENIVLIDEKFTDKIHWLAGNWKEEDGE